MSRAPHIQGMYVRRTSGRPTSQQLRRPPTTCHRTSGNHNQVSIFIYGVLYNIVSWFGQLPCQRMVHKCSVMLSCCRASTVVRLWWQGALVCCAKPGCCG